MGELRRVRYHRLVVAFPGPREEAEAELRQAGVEAERVCWLEEWPFAKGEAEDAYPRDAEAVFFC